MERKQIEALSCVCEPDECDTFNFMSKKLGINVLHPGGLDATEILAERCGISENMTVLDAGCGSGTTSLLLAKKYGCRVVGVDIDQNLLIKANKLAYEKSASDRIAFRYADIHDLPFHDEVFDGSIIQATLIFTGKNKALQMLSQKIRPNGFLGVIELAWKSNPPAEIVQRVRNVICDAAVNTERHEDWIDLLRQAGLDVVNAELKDLGFNLFGMLRNEGIFSTSRIALKCIFNETIRRKTKEITNLFKETKKYLGYGIYICRKR